MSFSTSVTEGKRQMEIILQKALPHQQKAVDAVRGAFAGVTFLPPQQLYANP